jgi:DnaK suppressor protein
VKKRDAEFFRRLLRERMRELIAEAGRTVDSMDGDENMADPADRASLESSRNSILRIRDRERKLIFKIDEALRRLDEGAYGICENCGENISLARLKARPVTTLCIECKSEQEDEERRARRFL